MEGNAMFKDNLITLRKRAGLSQEQLANTLGISRQSVSKYELGTAEPDLARLAELKNFFHVTYDELLSDGIQPVSKLANVTNGWITIQSAVRDKMIQVSDFSIAAKPRPGQKKVQAALLGHSATGSFLGKETYILGYYATKQDANKELNAIQCAIQHGEPIYELQYCLRNVKNSLVGVLFTK
jgi:transcriptional regulator with XRE-family HTH domain